MSDNILIVGSLNMDIVINLHRMPVIGETVFGESLTYIPGGKGANQASAAGKLGGKAVMLGCVGQDDFGKALIRSLSESGVEVSRIRQTEGGSGSASIYVDGAGDNRIVVIPGANSDCDAAYLKEMEEAFSECTYILIQMEIPMEAVSYGVKRARELGKTVILNPAPAPDFLPKELLPKIDFLTPNETELLKLTGQTVGGLDEIKKGAGQLVAQGVKHVIVTMGKQGCMLVSEDRMEIFPARNVVSVDTTAAGDCFNGAFAVALAEGKGVEEAIRFANLASSIAVTRAGAQKSLPEREEVDAMIRQQACNRL